MDCAETRDVLDEYRQGGLAADAAGRLEAHLAECSTCRQWRQADDTLAARLRALPRTPAPPSLRRQLRASGRRRPGPVGWLARPWVAAVLAASLVAALLVPWGLWHGSEPVDELIEAAIDQYKGLVLQFKGFGGAVTDPAVVFGVVRALTDIPLPAAWAQDPEFPLVAARPTVIANRRAAVALLARDPQFVTACFLLRAADLPMPRERRVRIGQYRPLARQADGLRAIYWKRGEFAYLVVTNLDETRSRDLFLRMRQGL